MCPDARRLTLEYADAVALFEAQQAKLEANLGTLPRREYLELSRAVGESRAAAECAHAALERHFREHACRSATA